jgi:hypothetical protein
MVYNGEGCWRWCAVRVVSIVGWPVEGRGDETPPCLCAEPPGWRVRDGGGTCAPLLVLVNLLLDHG